MKSIKYTLLVLCLLTTVGAMSQSKNPYKSIGKKGEVLTLTKDKYEELFDQDSVQQIGTALINVHTLKVVKLLTEGAAKDRLENEKQSRFLSVDPLTRTYPWYTPYQYAGNKPVWATDLDGLEENTTSTFVKKPTVIFAKPTFNGIITITNATTQAAHKTFQGNYAQLKKADAAGMAPSIVSQLTGSNVGTADSKLDITITGQRQQVVKTWKGTDIKYFTQYSYSFISNNVTEQGTFEMQTGNVQASARIWDPAAFLVLNKVVSAIVINVARIGGPAATEEMVTLYRSISKAEAESIQSTKQLTLGEGAMEVKQFWQTKQGLNKFNSAGFGGEFTLEVSVPKSMVGEGKLFNTATQVDEFFGPTATVEGSELKAASQSIQTLKITPLKK